MSKGTVVSLFDKTGVMVQPWLDDGYTCYIVDIQHEEGLNADSENENLYRIGVDLSIPFSESFFLNTKLYYSDIVFVSAFPPCDHLAVSGAAWFKGKGLRKLADSIHLFATAAEFCESTDAAYMIENPVSTIASYWRKPDHYFHPYMFTGFSKSDNYTKKTCLWTGNCFSMPPEFRDKSIGEPNKNFIRDSDVKTRKEVRSITPYGFAKAVFEANKI